MKNRLKYSIKWMCMVVVAVMATGCSEWTDAESLKIDQNDITKQNPELYARYLSAVRDYKKSDHKIVFGWYDNASVPTSQASHLTVLPDSLDIVSLNNPDNLPSWLVQEKNEIRDQKGTRCVYSVSFTALEAAYALLPVPEEETPEVDPFTTFANQYMKDALGICSRWNYDGITVEYPGKSTVSMDATQKAEYLARQAAFLNGVKEWRAANEGKLTIFYGNPQYVSDQDFLASCDYLILPTQTLVTIESIVKAFVMASIPGVPADRFLIAVKTLPLEGMEQEGGYLNGVPALTQAAYWTIAAGTSYTKAGLAIDNLRNDYFNINQVYMYSREAVSIMNPAPKN